MLGKRQILSATVFAVAAVAAVSLSSVASSQDAQLEGTRDDHAGARVHSE